MVVTRRKKPPSLWFHETCSVITLGVMLGGASVAGGSGLVSSFLVVARSGTSTVAGHIHHFARAIVMGLRLGLGVATDGDFRIVGRSRGLPSRVLHGVTIGNDNQAEVVFIIHPENFDKYLIVLAKFEVLGGMTVPSLRRTEETVLEETLHDRQLTLSGNTLGAIPLVINTVLDGNNAFGIVAQDGGVIVLGVKLLNYDIFAFFVLQHFVGLSLRNRSSRQTTDSLDETVAGCLAESIDLGIGASRNGDQGQESNDSDDDNGLDSVLHDNPLSPLIRGCFLYSKRACARFDQVMPREIFIIIQLYFYSTIIYIILQ